MQFATNISSYQQLLHTTAFNILPELSTVCASRRKVGKWGNGEMGEWESLRMLFDR
jgi:hypothetical protein